MNRCLECGQPCELLLCAECESGAVAGIDADQIRFAPKLVYGQKQPKSKPAKATANCVYDPLTETWVTIQ